MIAKRSENVSKEDEQKRIERAHFLLEHLSGPLFPRCISTALTEGAQFPVLSTDEMINAFKKAEWIDCRISAFPYFQHDEDKESPAILLAPDFLFIDLDRSSFKSDEELEEALKDTLHRITRTLGGSPTVLMTGNGYHIYQPIENFVLENIKEFAKFENPSVKFLGFVSRELSGGKSDPKHNPSFKSCMLRVPGSFNSKLIGKVEDEDSSTAEVKIVQRWNSLRPRITKDFLKKFEAHLVKEKAQELKTQLQFAKYCHEDNSSEPGKVDWIEDLLQKPVADGRKIIVALILAPYLIVIRKLSLEEAYPLIVEWLDNCSKLRPVDGVFKSKLKMILKYAARKGIKPMSMKTLLSEQYRYLYDIIFGKV